MGARIAYARATAGALLVMFGPEAFQGDVGRDTIQSDDAGLSPSRLLAALEQPDPFDLRFPHRGRAQTRAAATRGRPVEAITDDDRQLCVGRTRDAPPVALQFQKLFTALPLPDLQIIRLALEAEIPTPVRPQRCSGGRRLQIGGFAALGSVVGAPSLI
jgi:hypothetical protein